MASKSKTKDNALEFMETGNAPEPQEQQETESLDETLNELAEEQDATEPVQEEEPEAEEAEEAPDKGKAAKKVEGEEEEADTGEDADGNVADVDPTALPDEVANLPRVQELVVKEEQIAILNDLLAEGYGYDLSNPDVAFKRLRAERADAAMLYAMIDGTLPASTLVSQLEDGVKKGVFQQEMVDRISSSLSDHFATSGTFDTYLKNQGLAVVPAAVAEELLKHAKANNLEFKIPLVSETVQAKQKSDPTASLRQEIEALKRQMSGQGAQPRTQTQGSGDKDYPSLSTDQIKVQKAFDGELTKFLADKNIPTDLFPEYHKAVIEMVQNHPGGAAAIIKRISAGNFVDIRRMATTYNNAMIERAQRYAGGVTQASKVIKKAGSASGTKTSGKPAGKPSLVKSKKPLEKADRISDALKRFERAE